MVPEVFIIPLFLVAFVMATVQYLRIDPKRRVLNVRFALMVGAAAAAIGYPIYSYCYPEDRRASWLLLALGLFWMATTYFLFRRVPQRQEY
ncbi:MAG TPA: hypothetical protein VGL95_08370 [Acetobacteraceae bacterium]|jgi:phosphotransferase system  glucose/maltose/N-acetylglucosamine-specific IIC component